VKIQTFIFNWRGQYEKVKEKEQQLDKLGIESWVINSDDNHKEHHWLNIGEESYFTAQFIKALEAFDADIFFHIQGDASYDNWKTLIDDALSSHKKYNWGIYAPNVDYTWYDSSRTDVPGFQFPEDNQLRVVANTDCTCWFIHRDIIDIFKNRKLDFSQYKMGWCWDIVFPALSFMNKRPVIRDYSHTIQHPKGTNYNTEQAEKEMWHLYQSLDSDIQEAFRYVKGERQYLAKYFV
jgi:hypothetical protein